MTEKKRFYTEAPSSPAEACERIAAALDGILLIRSDDMKAEEVRKTGRFPQSAYAVDVTGFYKRVSTDPDTGQPKSLISGAAETGMFEADKWYEETGSVYNRRNEFNTAAMREEEARAELVEELRRILPAEESDGDRLLKLADAIGLDVTPKTEELPAPYIKDQVKDLARNVAREASLAFGLAVEKAREKWVEVRRHS
ncbi:hypothetical protein SEA_SCOOBYDOOBYDOO_217 [Mycobacterium phage ScoobyDoobyDoo]|nr:hypothetical protein SEA_SCOOBYDOOBYDOO_217 [Mycobacterium phage ScoobyDoobyDoo]